MSKNFKALILLAKTTLIGIMLLIILLIVSFIISGLIVDIFFLPGPPVLGGGLENIGKSTLTFTVLYVLSTCIAGLISGFLIRYWREEGTRAWHSLFSGFIIGISIPGILSVIGMSSAFLFLFVFSDQLFFVNEAITVFVYSLISALVGLLGYYLAERKYNQPVLSNQQ
jgi:hypothetical protein